MYPTYPPYTQLRLKEFKNNFVCKKKQKQKTLAKEIQKHTYTQNKKYPDIVTKNNMSECSKQEHISMYSLDRFLKTKMERRK